MKIIRTIVIITLLRELSREGVDYNFKLSMKTKQHCKGSDLDLSNCMFPCGPTRGKNTTITK